MLDPCVVLKCIFQDPFELSYVLYDFSFCVLVVYCESQFESWLARSLPKILAIVTSFRMVELTEASETEELFTRWGLILLVDRCQERLDLGTLITNNEAAEAVSGNVLIGHVQFVDKLSSVWNELLHLVV